MLLWCLISAVFGTLMANLRGGLSEGVWARAVGVQGLVTAAALASGLFGLLMYLNIEVLPAAGISALAGFALRAMAIWKGWAIPAYRG